MEVSVCQSWGVASARHTSGCVVCPLQQNSSSVEQEFDVPLGPSVVRWCARTKRRVLQFQAHSDLITCMKMSPDRQYIVTTSYSGELKLWSGEGWRCECDTQAPMPQQQHLAWRLDSKGFVTVGNGFQSSIAMYSLLTKHTSVKFQLLWQIMAKNVNTKGSASEFDSAKVTNTGRDYLYSDAFTMAEINPNSNVFAVKEKENGSVSVHLFSNEGESLKEVDINEKSVPLLSAFNTKMDAYAMVVQGGIVLIIGGEDLIIRTKFHAGYTSRSCVWDGEHLVLPSDSGKLVWWSMFGERLFEAAVDVPGCVVHLQLSLNGRALWVCGFSRLNYVEVDRNSDGTVRKLNVCSSVHSHDIACCGVAFSDRGGWMCAGDLAGGVWAIQGTSTNVTHKISVEASVRCLVWFGETHVLIGCLDGRVVRWRVGEEEAVEEVCRMEGSVIIMRWNQDKTLLAVGSSTGVLTICSALETNCGLVPETSFTAHPPQLGNKDMRFGQLSKQAEIWSLCWSPSSNQIATCSEDQTTKIWNVRNWSCQATLRGHTMAVTGVDWKQSDFCGSILATCSDDRTIRVMDGNSFKLMRTLSTKDIYGWHTLTYITLHLEWVPPSPTPPSKRLLLTCTTQHGYVVVWDVESAERTLCKRMHCGSIEGLAANAESGTLATVGADCAVHLFRLQ